MVQGIQLAAEQKLAGRRKRRGGDKTAAKNEQNNKGNKQLVGQ